VRSLAIQLAVGEKRAKVIRQMMSHLRKTDPISLATSIEEKWRTRRGTRMKPSTVLTYVTAVQVAANVMNLESDKWAWRRVMRGIKKRLSLHVPKQAVPMRRAELKAVINHPRVATDVKKTIAFMWLLALRFGDLPKIQKMDVSAFKDRMRIRCRGLKGYEMGRTAHFRWLPLNGVAKVIWPNLVQATRSHFPKAPIFKASRSRVLRALRLVNPSLSTHSIRRGVATHLADRGHRMSSISKFLGHANVEVTRKYVQPRPSQPEAKSMLRMAKCVA
jgi:integrase